MEELYSLMLLSALGAGGSHTREVMEYFGSARGVFEAGDAERRLSGLFSPSATARLASADHSDAERQLAAAQRLNLRLLTYNDAEYPARLRKIDNPPLLLFVRGELPEIDSGVCIAVVGTRKPTEYGRECATRLAAGLAQEGAAVISGGALGIDTAAHCGALLAGGKTVAVLGCGIGYPYLTENESLRESISAHGALVSEYPPDFAPARYTFAVRNRIISGLSLGTAVIEAGEKSGALITAQEAIRQKRGLFCVTGGMTSKSFAGSNRLLAEGKAAPVFAAQDILAGYREGYRLFPTGKNEPQTSAFPDAETTRKAFEEEVFELPELKIPVSENASRLYSAFCSLTETQERIISRSGLSAREAASALTELEIKGVVAACGGGRCRVCG